MCPVLATRLLPAQLTTPWPSHRTCTETTALPAQDESATIADTVLDGSWKFYTSHTTTVSTECRKPWCFSFVGCTAWLVGSYCPDLGWNPGPWQWKHQVLTTGPPGNSPKPMDFWEQLTFRLGSATYCATLVISIHTTWMSTIVY